MPTYDETVSGGIVSSGNANTQQLFTHIGSGEITLESNTRSVPGFFKNTTVLWNTYAKIQGDIGFLWNAGRLRSFWFRIIGGNGQGGNCPPIQDPCCQRFVMNIHARSLTELCEKLSTRKFKWPIQSVHKFSRPAENDAVAEDELAGISRDCNELEPVEICQIPQCADFCVQHDLSAEGRISWFAQVNGFFNYVASGNAFTGGSASASRQARLTVGVTVGGAAKVTPFFDETLGSLLVAGKAVVYQSFVYEGSGTVTLSSYAPQAILSFTASGSAIIDGEADVRSSAYKWVSDGNIVFILGSAGQRASDLGRITQENEMQFVVLETTATFLLDVDTGDAEGPTSLMSRCGCVTVPLTVNLNHNLTKTNLLSKFLHRNNFSLARTIGLKYNVPNDSWQTNIHYKGYSAQENILEKWKLLFELQCSDLVGGELIGRNIWRLAIQITRENLTTLEDFDTRLIVAILPELICGNANNELNFEAVIDTQLKISSVTPNATIYENVIFDNIGLFKTKTWVDAPNLTLRVSQSNPGIPVNRLDQTDLILV